MPTEISYQYPEDYTGPRFIKAIIPDEVAIIIKVIPQTGSSIGRKYSDIKWKYFEYGSSIKIENAINHLLDDSTKMFRLSMSKGAPSTVIVQFTEDEKARIAVREGGKNSSQVGIMTRYDFLDFLKISNIHPLGTAIRSLFLNETNNFNIGGDFTFSQLEADFQKHI